MSPSTAFNIPENEKNTAQRLTSVLDAKVSDSCLSRENQPHFIFLLLCAVLCYRPYSTPENGYCD